MYDNALAQNSEIYDLAKVSTNDFQRITSTAICQDSRIIKILRYAIAPSISQMKFGQFFGLGSIAKFENDRLEPGTTRHNALKAIAPKIAIFATSNLDLQRFIWVPKNAPAISDQTLASNYAKGWTCSIAADQNAQTRYRNWRKDQQEHSIASALISLGYTKSSFSGIISKHNDIKLGEFTQELRVQGRTRQKADLIVRSKKTKKLVLIEAKAVGVEIDSTKRIKECCDKANDWQAGQVLNNPVVVTASKNGCAPLFPEPTHQKGDGLFFSKWQPLGEFLSASADTNQSNYTFPTETLGKQLNELPDGSGLKSKGKAEPTRPGGHFSFYKAFLKTGVSSEPKHSNINRSETLFLLSLENC